MANTFLSIISSVIPGMHLVFGIQEAKSTQFLGAGAIRTKEPTKISREGEANALINKRCKCFFAICESSTAVC